MKILNIVLLFHICFGRKCELSGSFKEVYLTLDSWFINESQGNIKYTPLCSIIAYQRGYLAYKYDREYKLCHLVELLNRKNISLSSEKLQEEKLSVDSYFIKSPLIGMYMYTLSA